MRDVYAAAQTVPALTPEELIRHNAFFLAPEFNAAVAGMEDDK